MCITKILYRCIRFRRTSIRYGNYRLSAYLADTPLKRMLGLMHRDGLKRNECMLFSFWKAGRYGVWMLNMRFPIDIVWLDEKMKIIDIVKNARPCKNVLGCATYMPETPAKYIVELKAGFAKRYGMHKGGSFRID